MPLRRKLLWSMVIPALLLGMLGGIGVYSLRHLEQAAGRILADNYRSIQEARRMSRSLNRLEWQEDTALSGAAGDAHRQEAASAIEKALRRCEGNITETGEAAVVRRIRETWDRLRPGLSRPSRAGSAAARDCARRLKAMRADIDEMVSLNERAMITYEKETRRVARGMLAAVTLSALMAFLALALFAIISARRISGPVTEVADRLHQALNPGASGRAAPSVQTVDEISGLREELDALLLRLTHYEDEQSRKLSHLQDREQQRFEESRRRFISMLSHQLKTPMTSLQMSVNLLGERLAAATPAEAELLSIAKDSCNSLGALVSDLIEASREVTLDLALKPRRVDIAHLLRSALRPLMPQADEKGIALVVPEQGPILSSVDPVKFPWVVTNIAGNALRYTPRGGRVTVALHSGQGYIEVSVKDTGTGIARESIGRIFEPYVSLDPDPKPGTHGLGLAIAKEIVEAHGGRIEAVSKEGQGTEFIIRLPS